MTQEAEKNPAQGQSPEEEQAEEGPGDDSENEEKSQPGGGWGNLFSPQAVVMFLIAGVFDFLSVVCAILIALFGIGLALSKVVYVIAFLIIGGWAFFRSGSTSIKQDQKKAAELAKKKLSGFLKRNKGKLIGKFIPVIGDLIPYWLLTVYSELKNS